MRKNKLLILSALVGVSSFVLPRLFAWCASIYMVPLFYAVLKKYKLTFKDGYLWGLIFFGLHTYAIFVLLYMHVYWYMALIGYLFLVNYYALVTGIMFALTDTISHIYKARYYRLAIWVIGLWCLLIVLQDYSSLIFARKEGLPLFSPLIPLAQYPSLLWPLAYTGGLLFLLVLITMQAIGAYASLHMLYFLIIAGGVGVGWFIIESNKVSDSRPMLLDRIGYINAPTYHGHPYETVQQIVLKIRELRKRYSAINVIFMPESTFKFPLNNYPDIPQIVTNNCLNNASLILGSHYSDNKKSRFNAAFHLKECLITQRYDKQHLMLFGEEMPYATLFNLKGTSLLNHKEYNWCCDSAYTSNIFRIDFEFSFTCAICSEVYFNAVKPVTLNGYPLVVIANDSWVRSTPYYQYLLLLLTRYKAMLWHQDIIYICHSGGWWITKQGTLFELNN